MIEKDLNYESKPPEFKYELGDSQIKVLQASILRFEHAMESMINKLTELVNKYEISKSKKEMMQLKDEIAKYEDAIETNNQILREFYEVINYWENELEKSATEMLVNLDTKDILPN